MAFFVDFLSRYYRPDIMNRGLAGYEVKYEFEKLLHFSHLIACCTGIPKITANVFFALLPWYQLVRVCRTSPACTENVKSSSSMEPPEADFAVGAFQGAPMKILLREFSLKIPHIR